MTDIYLSHSAKISNLENKHGKILSRSNEIAKSKMAASIFRCACNQGKTLIRSNLKETYSRQKVANETN